MLTLCAAFALLASILVQFAGGFDFQGRPFLYFGIALLAIGLGQATLPLLQWRRTHPTGK